MPTASLPEAAHWVGVTRETPLDQIVQRVVATYYLIPYPGQPDRRKSEQSPQKEHINRIHHGAVHVTRAALLAEAFYEAHAMNGLTVIPEGMDEPTFLTLLKLAVIYHDCANISETEGASCDHAACFVRDMTALGFTQQEIDPFRTAIQEKDNPACTSPIKNILHDADCLEVIRVVGEGFDFDRLKLPYNTDKSKWEHRWRLSQTHTAVCRSFDHDEGRLHAQVESAANVDQAMHQAMEELWWSALKKADTDHSCTVLIDQIETARVGRMVLLDQTQEVFAETIKRLKQEGHAGFLYTRKTPVSQQTLKPTQEAGNTTEDSEARQPVGRIRSALNHVFRVLARFWRFVCRCLSWERWRTTPTAADATEGSRTEGAVAAQFPVDGEPPLARGTCAPDSPASSSQNTHPKGPRTPHERA